MQYSFRAVTDVGTVKKVNEDNCFVRTSRIGETDICFCVLCDGMGGLQFGDKASEMAVCSFYQWFQSSLENGVFQTLPPLPGIMEQFHKVNSQVYRFQQSTGQKLGTTAAVLLLCGGRYAALNIGDTRIYLLRDRLTQISHDHSYVQSLVDAGQISREEASRHPRRNVLTQCLGMKSEIVPYFTEGVADPTDLFIVCTDGLYTSFSEDEISTVLLSGSCGDELDGKLHYLVDVAKSRGQKDNLSIIAIRAQEIESDCTIEL